MRKLIREAEGTFTDLIGETRTLRSSALYQLKEISSNQAGRELAAERGYSCKKGSTHGSLAQVAKRSFF